MSNNVKFDIIQNFLQIISNATEENIIKIGDSKITIQYTLLDKGYE